MKSSPGSDITVDARAHAVGRKGLRKPSRRESRTQRSLVHRVAISSGILLAGARGITFRRGRIPEFLLTFAAPDAHTVMIVYGFCASRNGSSLGCPDGARHTIAAREEKRVFSRLPARGEATLYQPLNRLQPSYLVNEDCRCAVQNRFSRASLSFRC